MALPKRLREEKIGKSILRLLNADGKIVGMVVGSDLKIDGDDPDIVWDALKRRAGEGGPNFVGHQGATARFLDFFPDGFSDPRYLEDERAYKVAASEKLRAELPITEAVSGFGNGETALAIFRKTNMLSPFEKTRLTEALRSDTADDFVRGAANFANGEIVNGLAQMHGALKPHEVAKWTAVTYLPFLWKPAEHAYLKPEVMRRFAERIGHRYAHEYTPELRAETYASLLDLHQEAMTQASDLNPRDYIDIQSYIYVVGEYTAEDKE